MDSKIERKPNDEFSFFDEKGKERFATLGKEGLLFNILGDYDLGGRIIHELWSIQRYEALDCIADFLICCNYSHFVGDNSDLDKKMGNFTLFDKILSHALYFYERKKENTPDFLENDNYFDVFLREMVGLELNLMIERGEILEIEQTDCLNDELIEEIAKDECVELDEIIDYKIELIKYEAKSRLNTEKSLLN